MDMSQMGVAETGKLHLKDAKGDFMYDGGKPVCVHVFSPGSEEYAIVETRQTQRALKRREDNDGKVTLASPEQRVRDEAEDLAAITHSFENLTYAGKAGGDLFVAVYSDRRLGFINKQVTKFVGDWSNFLPVSTAA